MTVNELPGWLALTTLCLIVFGCFCFAAAGATVLARALRGPRATADKDAVRSLANACCERWWTSLGTHHDPRHCTRKDTTR